MSSSYGPYTYDGQFDAGYSRLYRQDNPTTMNPYQNLNPYQSMGGWGQPQFAFGAPPVPQFQAQPNWGGADYYRAHTGMQDLSIYDNAFNKFQSLNGSSGYGVGATEAEHWHRRAYGGPGELARMLPQEVGHAAAFEAWRTWSMHTQLYEPLSGDRARQIEGLIGMAIGEATRLFQFAGRGMDGYGLSVASSTAAATANLIYSQNSGMLGGYGGGYSRSRANSFTYGGGGRPISPMLGAGVGLGGVPYAGSGSIPFGGGVPIGGVPGSYSGESYLGNGLYPDSYDIDRRSRSRHRHRSRSRSRPPAEVITIPPPGGIAGGYPVSQGYPMYGGGGSFNAGYAGSSYQQPPIVIRDEGKRHRHGRSRSGSENGYYVPGYAGSYGSNRY